MKQTVVHEVQDMRHRIVLINENGTNTAGEWSGTGEIAHHEKYFAITGESVLPQGIFTVREIPHQVLA